MRLSVIIPTLNCGNLVDSHLATMRKWLDVAQEVLVVDSFSEDDTVAKIKHQLTHPNLKFLSHPRGLYQSWNYAISKATGDWIYISTVGDSIERSHLLHLLSLAENPECNVVSSKPTFVTADGKRAKNQNWPIDRIRQKLRMRGPLRLTPEAVLLFSLVDAPMGFVASAASNIYKTAFLQKHPYLLDFGYEGDGAWAIRYAYESKITFTPRKGSTFRLHPKSYTLPPCRTETKVAQMRELWIKTVKARLAKEKTNTSAEALLLSEPIISEHFKKRMELENFRKSLPHSWIFSTRAWPLRLLRNQARNRLNKTIRLLCKIIPMTY